MEAYRDLRGLAHPRGVWRAQGREPRRFTLESSRVCRPVAIVWHQFDEKPYPAPNPHEVNSKSNPDLNQKRKVGTGSASM
jgi:hypothetical protein